jgi:hypothetical protein
MIKVSIAVLFSVSMFAQAPVANAALPGNWVGTGATYSSAAHPRIGAWVSLAILANRQTGIYSYSSYDILPRAGKVPTTAARTGVALLLRQVGPVYVLGLGTAGASTSATATTGSFSGGGAAVYRFKTSWSVLLEAQVVNQTGKTVRLGFGREW